MSSQMRAFVYILVVSVFSSCVTHRPIQYLEGNFDSLAYKQVKWQAPVVQPGDLLSIVVRSDNADATALYNLGGGFSSSLGSLGSSSSGVGKSTTSVSSDGYLVEQDGSINMVGVGKMNVAGKNKNELVAELVNHFISKDLLKNPTIDIRYLNFKVTVLGEVNNPGSFSLPTERINLLEALAQAGGLTSFAIKEKVTIIREQSGQRNFVRLDLYEPGFFNSPYYQLKQNDIIMVPANDKKEASEDQLTFRYISLGTSIVSVLAILINLVR